jgi:hypothetical protein
MSPVIDFTEVKGLDPVPAGKYEAKIVHAEEGQSNSGNPKIEIRWEITFPAESAGRLVFDTLSFHPDAQFRVKDTLMALGFDSEFKGEVTGASLIGKEAQLTITIEASSQLDESGDPYPPRNKVKRVRRIGATSTEASAPQGKGIGGLFAKK